MIATKINAHQIAKAAGEKVADTRAKIEGLRAALREAPQYKGFDIMHVALSDGSAMWVKASANTVVDVQHIPDFNRVDLPALIELALEGTDNPVTFDFNQALGDDEVLGGDKELYTYIFDLLIAEIHHRYYQVHAPVPRIILRVPIKGDL